MYSDISRRDIKGGKMKNPEKDYIPMSETAYYILLALTEECHGYGIIQKVEAITSGRLRIGAGTIYGTLSKFEKDGLINPAGEEERKKMYKISETGKTILKTEYKRICELAENGKKIPEV